MLRADQRADGTTQQGVESRVRDQQGSFPAAVHTLTHESQQIRFENDFGIISNKGASLIQ